MNKTLFKSIREYKKQSMLAPILVILEVLMEVLIPLEMAKIIDVGIANGDLGYIVQRGIILVAMAMLALFFGVQAGNMAAVAAAGYAKNLRHDIFYKVQDFSFKNIDHFSTSGLVTRMTTDIKRTDGIHDEYPSSGESSDHGDLILGHDTFDQCQDRTSVPGRDPGSRRSTDVHCKKSTSAFYQSI